MGFKPNYSQQRAERERIKRGRKAEKLNQLQERTAQRKAEREKPVTEKKSEQT